MLGLQEQMVITKEIIVLDIAQPTVTQALVDIILTIQTNRTLRIMDILQGITSMAIGNTKSGYKDIKTTCYYVICHLNSFLFFFIFCFLDIHTIILLQTGA